LAASREILRGVEVQSREREQGEAGKEKNKSTVNLVFPPTFPEKNNKDVKRKGHQHPSLYQLVSHLVPLGGKKKICQGSYTMDAGFLYLAELDSPRRGSSRSTSHGYRA